MFLRGFLRGLGFSLWFFCGQDVVDWMGKVVLWEGEFGAVDFARFADLFCGFVYADEGIPQGLKPLGWLRERGPRLKPWGT